MSTNGDEDHDGSAVAGALITLTVPEDKVQTVLDFVEGLQREQDDVSGFMLSRGMIGSFAGPLSVTQTSHTGITTFQTGADGTDLKWSDTDTITT